MMKKILSLILVLAIVFSLAACTSRPEDSAEPSEPQNTVAPTPEAQPDSSPAQSDGKDGESEAPPAKQPESASPSTPSAQPEETPEPSSEPEETPAPSETPKQEPQENANEGKVDASATVTTTSTDLAAPADSSFLALIPELPFEGWASTASGENSVMLELSSVPADVQSKLLEYIQDLHDDGFEVTEYTYGSLYDAVKGDVTVTLMLEGGKLTVLIEKK